MSLLTTEVSESVKSYINICPACGGAEFIDGDLYTGQPTTLNYRCQNPKEAIALGRGIILLRECRECGLIFNAAFDQNLIRYDEAYDNRQGFSDAFKKHLESVADIATAHLPARKRVIEVGCGKGEFLRILRDRGCSPCVGYDTSCPDTDAEEDQTIQYHRAYVGPCDIQTEYDLVVCRHVVEHVSEIGVFLKSLSEISKAAGDSLVAIETPVFDWIVDNGCFWDFFYEHCNYFTFSTLAGLLRRANLEILSHSRVFGGQYQLILAKPTAKVAVSNSSAPVLSAFTEITHKSKQQVESRIGLLRECGDWGIWGGGAKGVTLASRIDVPGLKFVIDSNPSKVGCYLPASRVRVISPSDSRIASLSLIVIANPMYEAEIRKDLDAFGYKGKVMTV